MARKEFAQFEAVSAAVRGDEGYCAAIAVKGLGATGAPRFHKVLEGQTFKTAMAADEAACSELERLQDVSDDADLVW
ncbi:MULTISPECIES: hypothetical protein [Pseudomonas]|uniref:Uncharacterized protein n=1 Tax=Pseudomonas auratipiscis TaxID=3115853 RepID=A0AB35WUM9_9PSED|nr:MULTISPECIES: hypothetical protein [unclassified Pseudomonas]MEE1868328.1 hypothetical protein [Pseudomonas sp. 120P]MEE1957277.1 hypothetical protein [Pseudomonas sp. 119P]